MAGTTLAHQGVQNGITAARPDDPAIGEAGALQCRADRSVGIYQRTQISVSVAVFVRGREFRPVCKIRIIRR